MSFLTLFQSVRDKKNLKRVEYKTSLEDVSQYQVILISNREHLITNIDHNFLQTLSRDKRSCSKSFEHIKWQ